MFNVGIKLDFGKFIRDLNVMTRGPNSFYAQGDQAIREALLEDFRIMVQETPQYSGSTAASWRIGFYAPTEYTMIPPPASASDALSRGMEPAVGYAMSAAMGSLPVTGMNMLKNRKDITITNGAPGYETAEEGPVRAVNSPPGALKRFQERFKSRTIVVNFRFP